MKIGFFGKLPGYGDFVQRNVSPGLVDFWDNWLSQSIDTSKAKLQDQWKQVYLTSPIWRFTIAPDSACESLLSGLMMPSVDAAGRDYPFIVFCEMPNQTNVFQISALINEFHKKAEVFLLSLLDASRPHLDDLAQHLERNYNDLERCIQQDTPSTCSRGHTGELYRYDSIHCDSITQVHHRFLLDVQARHQIATSVWLYGATERLNHHCRYYQGMPPVDAFSSLLEGQ